MALDTSNLASFLGDLARILKNYSKTSGTIKPKDFGDEVSKVYGRGYASALPAWSNYDVEPSDVRSGKRFVTKSNTATSVGGITVNGVASGVGTMPVVTALQTTTYKNEIMAKPNGSNGETVVYSTKRDSKGTAYLMMGIPNNTYINGAKWVIEEAGAVANELKISANDIAEGSSVLGITGKFPKIYEHAKRATNVYAESSSYVAIESVKLPAAGKYRVFGQTMRNTPLCGYLALNVPNNSVGLIKADYIKGIGDNENITAESPETSNGYCAIISKTFEITAPTTVEMRMYRGGKFNGKNSDFASVATFTIARQG